MDQFVNFDFELHLRIRELLPSCCTSSSTEIYGSANRVPGQSASVLPPVLVDQCSLWKYFSIHTFRFIPIFGTSRTACVPLVIATLALPTTAVNFGSPDSSSTNLKSFMFCTKGAGCGLASNFRSNSNPILPLAHGPNLSTCQCAPVSRQRQYEPHYAQRITAGVAELQTPGLH